jgi:hypothetical protein
VVTDEQLCAWERVAVWEKPEGRLALQMAIDEIRRLTTCVNCEKRFEDGIPLIGDGAHRFIANKRLCQGCYTDLCSKVYDDLSCRKCRTPVREGLLYCAGLSACWRSAAGVEP